LLHLSPPQLLSQSVVYQEGRKGAAAPQKSRVSASLRSTSPLSLRSGHALDCFHPAGKKHVSGFLRKSCLSIFLLA
jgi:hypothetical protein